MHAQLKIAVEDIWSPKKKDQNHTNSIIFALLHSGNHKLHKDIILCLWSKIEKTENCKSLIVIMELLHV